MPFKPRFEGDVPTLGYQVLEFVTDNLIIPDGDSMGLPFVLTDEQARLVLHLFRLHPVTGKHIYRRGQLILPKGWGKSPFVATLAWAVAKGPVVFDGWDANGQPVGRPLSTPWVQIAALAEDQTENTWSPLLSMANPDEGAPLTYNYPDIDLGETRVNMKGRGKIEFVTSRAGTREGQRVNFGILDETGLWNDLRGHKLSRTIRRNTEKMGGLAGFGMVVETTNAYTRGEESVAESTYEAGQKASDIFVYHRESPVVEDMSKKGELKKALKAVYGDATSYIDLDRIVAAAQDPDMPPEDVRRFFLNRLDAGAEERYFDLEEYDAAKLERPLVPGEPVALGFDGSKFYDATGLVGVTGDGHIFRIGYWPRPERAPDDWKVPSDEVDRVVDEAFNTYNVVRFYCDPPYWQDYIDKWKLMYGDDKVFEWWTNRPTQMEASLERINTAIKSGEGFSHDGDPDLRAHFFNAYRHVDRNKVTIRKEFPRSPNKIDLAMAATIAYEARGDAIAAGEMKAKRRYRSFGG